ncbi:MAG: ketoacyl-ACP synthase III [Candidatus Zixiibacteriota bacterium]|nr:MAG: ketoacyl-ACP synthase III [candidate division Zixibacteria bacterium]
MNGRITGVGSFLPSHRVTNADMEKLVDTSDEWIRSRTGILERRRCAADERNSDMAVAASWRAMEMANLRPEEIELLVVGTVTPDYRLPSTACVVQKKMGLVNAATMDIAAACAGFIHGLSIADSYIRSGQYRRILVIGTEKLTSVTNYRDRNTCVLFGDGAGAAVVESTEEDRGILSTFLRSDGRMAELLWIPDGGSNTPPQTFENGDGNFCIEMTGSEVFRHAVRQMGDASLQVLKMAGLEPSDVTWLLPHQANIRIMESTAKRIGIPSERVFMNIAKYGNTSSASVPIALDEVVREGKVEAGDILLMTAFGGGLTWASAAVKW